VIKSCIDVKKQNEGKHGSDETTATLNKECVYQLKRQPVSTLVVNVSIFPVVNISYWKGAENLSLVALCLERTKHMQSSGQRLQRV